MAKTLGTRRSSRRPIQDTDFNGNPIAFQRELPENEGIVTEFVLPRPGDRVTSASYGPGTVLSVGDPMWGAKWKNIEVRFDTGEKWFVSRSDLGVA